MKNLAGLFSLWGRGRAAGGGEGMISIPGMVQFLRKFPDFFHLWLAWTHCPARAQAAHGAGIPHGGAVGTGCGDGTGSPKAEKPPGTCQVSPGGAGASGAESRRPAGGGAGRAAAKEHL